MSDILKLGIVIAKEVGSLWGRVHGFEFKISVGTFHLSGQKKSSEWGIISLFNDKMESKNNWGNTIFLIKQNIRKQMCLFSISSNSINKLRS